MAETLEYTTAKRKTKPITFKIDGEDYTFKPPKDATALMPLVEATGDEDVAALRAQFDWLSKGLPKAQNDRIIEKLKDEDDDFDFDDLENIVKWLTKVANGRPTG